MKLIHAIMKRLYFTLLVLCLSLSTSAQAIRDTDVIIKDNSFSYVYKTDIPLTQLFGKVNQWVAKSFNDYKSVIQYEDKENHRLIMKGILVLGSSWVDNLSLSLTFDCKEGKYRILADGMIIKVGAKEFSYERYVSASVEEIFGVAPVDSAIIDELQAQRQVAFEKFEKAKKKWKPSQFHYQKPKAELDELDERINKVLAYNAQAELFLKTRETDINSKIADLYNNISSFIAAEDDF